MSFLRSIGTAVPAFVYPQSVIADFMVDALATNGNGSYDKLRTVYQKTSIDTRHSVIPDYGSEPGDRKLFSEPGDFEASIEARMRIFQEEAFPLAEKAILDCLHKLKSPIPMADFTHLITVSCTGMVAPGLELEISQKMAMNPGLNRFAVNFIGCYAAFHALKLAHSFCTADPEAKVLVVCVELCSLHFQQGTHRDVLAANALFADGAAAAVITGEKPGPQEAPCLSLDAFCTHVLPQGQEDMTWRISSTGFLMTLSSYVPSLVDEGMSTLFNTTLNRLKLKPTDIQHWAIHPGGRKVLEICEKNLPLTRQDLNSSYEVLSKYGNMSSATILFVLMDLLENKVKLHEKIFATGFGPGLTMESAVMSLV